MSFLNYYSLQNKRLLAIEKVIAFLIIYIPFEPFLLKFASDGIYPFLKYFAEILILILFFAVLSEHFLKKDKFIKTPIDTPLAAFIAITFVSSILNRTNLSLWILGLRQIFRYVLLYYAIIYSRLSKETAKKFIVLLFLVLLAQSIIGIGQAFIGKRADDFLLPGIKREFAGVISPSYVYQFWSSGQRIFSTMGRYDRLGTFICFALILAIGFLYEIKDLRHKKKLIALMILPIVVLILTYSRMSWLGFILALIFMSAVIRRDKKFILFFTVAILFLSVYLFIHAKTNDLKVKSIEDKASMTLASRFLSLFSLQELETSYNGYGRLYFIINTPKKVVMKYPFLGAGLGQYGSGVAYALQNKKIYNELGLPFGIEGAQGQIDNNWMSLWGETGSFGLLAFIGIVLSLFLYALKSYRTIDDDFVKGVIIGFSGIILAVSFQAFLGPYFEIRTLSFYFWFLAGTAVVLVKIEKEKIGLQV
ncbi:MAG: O-antigen ligase family protein [bacterium]